MKEYWLPKENGHEVYVAEYGNPKGPAIVSFHGGPGGKSSPRHAERFDLNTYRVLLFDQRGGSGKSEPSGETRHNTTQEILSDAERIRTMLGIEEWFVTGSSWGSTCALLYALKYKKRVRGMLLTSVFLADKDARAWATVEEHGAARMVPDVWERRMRFFKKHGIGVTTHNKDMFVRLEKGTKKQQQQITAALYNWEGNLFSTQASVHYTSPEDIADDSIASAKIFLWFEMHNSFIEEGLLMRRAGSLRNVPCVIVHGRYDVLCPLDRAYTLAKKMNAELVIATSSGHKLTAEGETIRSMAYDRFLEKHTQ